MLHIHLHKIHCHPAKKNHYHQANHRHHSKKGCKQHLCHRSGCPEVTRLMADKTVNRNVCNTAGMIFFTTNCCEITRSKLLQLLELLGIVRYVLAIISLKASMGLGLVKIRG